MLAITGGRVVPIEGDPVERGTVLVDEGRITAVGGPDLRVPDGGDWVRLVAWSAVAVGLLALGWRSAGGDEDAGAGEGADADRAVLDLHGDRPVG